MFECFINRFNKALFAQKLVTEAGAILCCPIDDNIVSSGNEEYTKLAVELGKAMYQVCLEFENVEELEKTIRLAATAPNSSCSKIVR